MILSIVPKVSYQSLAIIHLDASQALLQRNNSGGSLRSTCTHVENFLVKMLRTLRAHTGRANHLYH